MTPSSTPIYSALNRYIQENILRLHMPGHAGIAPALPHAWQNLALFDVTEIPGLDDLHLPIGIIEHAERLLAEAFGAQESFFLVNGATSGIHALFLSLPSPAKVLIPRHAHRSFFGGLVLSGAHPVYLPAEIDNETGLSLATSVTAVEDLLARQEVQAVFLTSPTFYGTTSNIREIAAAAHRRNIPVFIDEAHGAHFYFHPRYPDPALSSGADSVVHGMHKTLPVFNQGGALHLGHGFRFADRVKNAFSLLTTTSPSYPLLASMDLARHFMQQHGQELLDKGLQLAGEYRCKIDQLPGFSCPGRRLIKNGVTGADPLKILVLTDKMNISGFEIGRILRQHYNIQVEIEGDHYILAMMSMFHQPSDWERFYRALQAIAKDQQSHTANSRYIRPVVPPAPLVVKSPREAFQSASRRIPLAQARNRVSAEIVAAYPPGIPALLPGEMITGEIYDYLSYIRQIGVRVQGPLDHTLDTIAVLEI
ncbi:MAG TPA: aminotransferase class I/II-fold pyridoxal phosphate-dependent enzyme [Syntrophomonadaceae bacterium]|nr:aminotransferase class I/II-fold pyridoxal phosphate-dependent enzyme [Syntrophomonadaceae bacterium]HQA06994.1 aminotransferase class I/II-fold pyridoxal phosphate-dependent enzyme [Syntrophomonadaceae bacterium]HQE23871.1 aminotransferase class I/II-fold pyridoxal phosphate-dependent enzyme [Syntrophomonadaceae bacterium]